MSAPKWFSGEVDKALVEKLVDIRSAPTARELLTRVAMTPAHMMPADMLASRVEEVLTILDRYRPAKYSGSYDAALVVGEIQRALDGRQE